MQQDDSDADDHHSDEDEEEKEWQELQKDMKQKNINKNYQTASWPVHAPHYPEVSSVLVVMEIIMLGVN